MNIADSIKLNRIQIGIGGGMENMSKTPFLLPKARTGTKYGHDIILDHMALDGLEDAYEHIPMGELAERLATKYQFSRSNQDTFAISSMKKAQKAIEENLLSNEIIPINLKDRNNTIITHDEGLKKVNFEKIPTLKPAFKTDGTVTAATSSPISDGAAAVVLCSEQYFKTNNLYPKAIIKAYTTFSHEPEWFTTAPIPAIKNVLKESGWTVADVDLFEINEAFAVVPMAAAQDLSIPPEKLNVHGGALALGHPLGASGARILVTLLHALEKYGLKKGVAAACIGGGEAVAMTIEIL
jgi:acetyl-CoA C-acetyltransferase